MKLSMSAGRKLKYGGTSIALTALVLAIIIIVNVFFALLVQRFSWYVDLTPDLHFTISDECYELIGGEGDNTPIKMIDKFRAENKSYNQSHGLVAGANGYRDENVKITILFGMERDYLLDDDTTEYVLRNADELAVKYPDHVAVETVDMVRNPSRFTKYLSSNTEIIPQDSVIIECGSEYRIRALKSFFLFNEDGEAIAYNGEKTLASSILAVTRADVPVACYTVNHGESFPDMQEDVNGNITAPFIEALENAGYRPQPIDLSKDEIPETCRLLVTFDPKQDFIGAKAGSVAQSEIEKLDDFLANKNAFMVFMSPSAYDGAQGLTNLEEFLAEWGLAFRRDGNDPYKVRDDSENILGDSSAVLASYVENELAKAWSASMTGGAKAPDVVFPDSTAITYAEGYPLGYSSTYKRQVYDLFVTHETAKAWAGDREIAASTKADPLKLMAVSTQQYTTQEGDGFALDDFAYVMLAGSTEFGSAEYLDHYGNGDFMLSAFQLSGREPVAVGLTYKSFANYEIKSVTSADATRYLVILTVAPVLVSLCVGVFVIVRRKNR